MAGLLDFATDPQSAMMTQMALGLLSAGGPSSRPVSLGQAMGQAGQQGMQGYRDAQTNQVNQMKLDELKKRMAFMQNMNLQSPNLAQDALGAGALDLKDYLTLQTKDKPELVEVDDPTNPGRTVKKWVIPGRADGTNIGYAPMKAPEGMQYANGQLVGIPGYVDMKKQIAAAGRQAPNATPYFQFLPTADGYVAGNARTGQVAPVSIGGKTVMRATDSPLLQGQIAGAKETGQEQAKSSLNLPQAISKGEEALRLSDELLKHPGFKQAVGGSSVFGIQKIPGTDARDFMNRLDQVKGGAFLTAFDTLKGGGQITEMEGKKATEAIARMDNATSEAEFTRAVKDYQGVIRKAVNNAKMRAGNRPQQPAPLPSAVFDEADAILRGGQ